MSTSRYAIVIAGIVDNVVLWDGNADPAKGGWSPPTGATMVKLTNQACDIGWNYAGAATFTPVARKEAPTTEQMADEIAVLKARLAKLEAAVPAPAPKVG